MGAHFLPFTDEGLRIAANLEQRHDAWVSAIRQVEALPCETYLFDTTWDIARQRIQ
jgi:hypothetical protein